MHCWQLAGTLYFCFRPSATTAKLTEALTLDLLQRKNWFYCGSVYVGARQSCPWVGSTHGLGWVWLGWVEIFWFLVGWVGSLLLKAACQSVCQSVCHVRQQRKHGSRYRNSFQPYNRAIILVSFVTKFRQKMNLRVHPNECIKDRHPLLKAKIWLIICDNLETVRER